MNNIQLLGRPTTDLELKVTTTGKSVCSFTLAVQRKFNKDVTDFIPCVIWDKGAEIMSKYVCKGQLVAVDGSLYQRKYQDKDGNNRVAYEVNVENFYFAESKKSASTDIQADPLQDFSSKLSQIDNALEIDTDDDLPF